MPSRRPVDATSCERFGDGRVAAPPRGRLAPLALALVALAGLLPLQACTTEPALRNAGAEKEALCSACHTPSATARFAPPPSPSLAGQPKTYLVAQLQAFREQTRADSDGRFFMWPMAAGLDDASIDHLAAYFAAQKPPGDTPNAGAAPMQGKALFENGAPDRGIAPCSSCHGDRGQGSADFPRLSGQRRDYLRAQLQAFVDGSRTNPVMGAMAKGLSADDIQTVTAYLASL